MSIRLKPNNLHTKKMEILEKHIKFLGIIIRSIREEVIVKVKS